MPVTPTDIERRVSDAAFGNRLITNVFRGHVAEAIVAEALDPEWTWCSQVLSVGCELVSVGHSLPLPASRFRPLGSATRPVRLNGWPCRSVGRLDVVLS